MNTPFKKTSSLVVSLMALLLCLAMLVGCKKDEATTPEQPEIEFDTEDYTPPIEDAMTITSNLPAYVFPYDYKNFGAGFVNRLNNKVVEFDENNIGDIASVVIHSSQIETITNDIPLIITQLLTGNNIIILEPTVKEFNTFCDIITATYLLLLKEEDGQEFLDDIEVAQGARQTFEAFYDMSMDSSKIESMFLMDTDSKGIFAEAIAVRGCNFHIVDRLKGVTDSKLSHQCYDEETGEHIPCDPPQINNPGGSSPEETITPYTYGLFADMFTNWINEHGEYNEQVEQMRQRGVYTFNTRSESTTKLSLEDICSTQRVEYTISAPIAYNFSSPLPVSVSFEICSVFMEERNSDFYCIYKEIISYNQLMDCGPEANNKWRKSEHLGIFYPNPKENHYYPIYGPFLRNLAGLSICHPHTDKFINSTTQIVDIPSAESVQSVADVAVEKYSPQNSIGAVDKTSGFSHGFDGGLYIAKDPALNLGFSISYESSTTQTISDLEITVSTVNGIPKWSYIGQNLPISHYHLLAPDTHDIAPKTLREQLGVDQSWIWRVPNPQGSYRIFDQTDVTTTFMYYTPGVFYTHHKYADCITSKRVSFMLMPPPRSKQYWVMDVKPYSEELNTMLSSTHKRFWDKDNHELTLADSTDESRSSLKEFMSEFERDLNNKVQAWKNRGLTGEFTFYFYQVEGDDSYSFNFNVVP